MQNFHRFLEDMGMNTGMNPAGNAAGAAAGNAVAANQLGNMIGQMAGGQQQLANMMNRPAALYGFLSDFGKLSSNFSKPVHPGQLYQTFNKHARQMGVHQFNAGNQLVQHAAQGQVQNTAQAGQQTNQNQQANQQMGQNNQGLQ